MRLNAITEAPQNTPLFTSKRIWSDGITPTITVRFPTGTYSYIVRDARIANKIWAYASRAPGRAAAKLRKLVADGQADVVKH